MTDAEKEHRRIERMRIYLGEKSMFYRALTLMEAGLTDGEVAEALRLERRWKRVIEADVMRVLRRLMTGEASPGTLGARAWHIGKDQTASERKERAYAMLDGGASRVDLMRQLHVSNWAAGEYIAQWNAEEALKNERGSEGG